MIKIKTCLISIEKQQSIKILKNILIINKPKPSSFLFNTYFCFSDIPNSKNRNLNYKNSSKDNLIRGNTLDNLMKITRHEKKSDYNKERFNRLKIDPNDESFYGNYKFILNNAYLSL